MDKEGCFNETTACFYAANVVLAMSQLHAQDIVYRDLKPENLLVDAKGYIKMADFGFAKYIGSRKTFTICGTPDYQVDSLSGSQLHATEPVEAKAYCHVQQGPCRPYSGMWCCDLLSRCVDPSDLCMQPCWC